MTKIEIAEKAVADAKMRLAKSCSDHSGPTIQQFEKTWDSFGTGSEEAERLEFVANREENRKDKEYREAKNNLLHAEGLLRAAKLEEISE